MIRNEQSFLEKNKLIKTVVTGQQIGLLGGPLYTTYKVLGAIKLSKELNGKAVYWLETNDADFNEINHIDYPNKNGTLESLKWEKNSQGFSCGSIEVDKSLIKIIRIFFDSIRQTEFTSGLKEMVLDSYRLGSTLGEATKLLAGKMFGDLGIEIFDPQEKNFRQSTRELLLREAKRTPNRKQCNLFCIIEKKRVAIFRHNSEFFNRNENRIDLTKYSLVPNVKTRNVCQDLYFHTHTYIAGPGEVEYIKKLDNIYKFHNVKKARIKKRMSIILIEPKVKRLLKKLGVELSELADKKKDEFIKYITKKISGFDSKELYEKAKNLTDNYLQEIKEISINTKGIRKIVLDSLKRNIGKKRTLEKEKIIDFKKKSAFLFDHLMPYGKKQERIFNIFHYMNLYGGTDFIHKLYEKYDTNLKLMEI